MPYVFYQMDKNVAKLTRFYHMYNHPRQLRIWVQIPQMGSRLAFLLFSVFVLMAQKTKSTSRYVDYEQSLFSGSVRRASEKKSAGRYIGAARKLGARGAREKFLSLPVFARRRLFFWPISFRSRDGLSWERGTARSLVGT